MYYCLQLKCYLCVLLKSSCTEEKHLCILVNTMAANGLAMQGARALAGMVLTRFAQNIPLLRQMGTHGSGQYFGSGMCGES